mmetsp:Transcript_8207/g.24337  ORF Transcript_8207/g.24337 Transcript_8207/m.24337 type:complete len:210 (-) Transcript_8207:566-1195(-)
MDRATEATHTRRRRATVAAPSPTLSKPPRPTSSPRARRRRGSSRREPKRRRHAHQDPAPPRPAPNFEMLDHPQIWPSRGRPRAAGSVLGPRVAPGMLIARDRRAARSPRASLPRRARPQHMVNCAAYCSGTRPRTRPRGEGGRSGRVRQRVNQSAGATSRRRRQPHQQYGAGGPRGRLSSPRRPSPRLLLPLPQLPRRSHHSTATGLPP